MDEGEQKPAARPPASQNTVGAVTNFLSGDSGQKILMALVVLAGGGNIMNTNSASRLSQEEPQTAVKEIHELHDALNGMKSKQDQISKDVSAIRTTVEKTSPGQ
jgi:hypothetical protein